MLELWIDDRGQSLVETSLILSLIVILVIALISSIGKEVAQMYQSFLESWNA